MSNTTASKRKWAPKSSSGCKTCKSRHIRCDNQLPSCGSCQKSHRQCAYLSSDATEHDLLKIVLWQPDNFKLHQDLHRSPANTSEELRSLDFFRNAVAVKLGGFFDSSFWTHEILKVAQQEVSVCHAVVALSSLCEGFLNEDGAPFSTQEDSKTIALQQQSKAISSLRQKMEGNSESRPSSEIVLTTCILLICFEMFQNNFESAMSHMSSGLYVFCNWQLKLRAATSTDHPEKLMQQLRHVFGRLMLQTILFVDTKPQQWNFITPAFTPPLWVVPAVFISINEARDCLDNCMCSMYHNILTSQFHPTETLALQELPMETPSRAGLATLQEWKLSFASFVQRQNHKPSIGEQKAIALLKIQHITAYILATAHTVGGEDIFDTFEELFEKILFWASEALVIEPAEDGVAPLPLPLFDMAILPSLYFTASRCRQPLFRRQAVQLLRRGPKQEGIWHRDMLVNISERLIQIEELGLEEDMSVPGSARLTIINASINSSQREVTLHCCRQQFDREVTDVIHELITY